MTSYGIVTLGGGRNDPLPLWQTVGCCTFIKSICFQMLHHLFPNCTCNISKTHTCQPPPRKDWHAEKAIIPKADEKGRQIEGTDDLLGHEVVGHEGEQHVVADVERRERPQQVGDALRRELPQQVLPGWPPPHGPQSVVNPQTYQKHPSEFKAAIFF